MTGRQLKSARNKLGLSAMGLARALEIEGRWADKTIRRWEALKYPEKVPGPVAVAVRLMLGVEG